ncbi:MAG: FAD-dependent oxidoreductase [Acidithiobacillus sp.]
MSTVTLDTARLEARFRPLEESLPESAVLTEADRCYYCYDAPCVVACPTSIDIPGFIRAIAVGQPRRAAERILQANPLGASCSRVCPVETLCEQHCVRAEHDGGAVRIGLLQRQAMAHFSFTQQSESLAIMSGKRVAVVGAGPAGMTVAHLLAEVGCGVDVFEAKPFAGGLNESGIAAYKMLDNAAQQEANFLLTHALIRLHCGVALGQSLHLQQLRRDYDGVFLGVGLQGQQRLGIAGENLAGVFSAVPYIAQMRRGEPVSVGQTVLVIGGGMTAMDIAIQARLLGAREVHVCYRRGVEAMGASAREQQMARDQGVYIHDYLRPIAIEGKAGICQSVLLQPTALSEGRLIDVGEPLRWMIDQVFTAIGQCMADSVGEEDMADLHFDQWGKIAVDAQFRTNLKGIWAGGDCTGRSDDLTVHAVADAKAAVLSMMVELRTEEKES